MNIIVKKLMSEFIEDYEIEEVDDAKQFEYFSTYCVVENKFDEDFSTDYIIGDGGDHGIDGILIYCNGEIVTDLDQADDLIARSKKLMGLEFVCIQAKTSEKFCASEISNFGYGVNKLSVIPDQLSNQSNFDLCWIVDLEDFISPICLGIGFMNHYFVFVD